jgi:hypothetical protein
MVVKVSRSQRAAARRLIEIAEAEGQPVDERLEAIASAEPAERSEELPEEGPSRSEMRAYEHRQRAALAVALATTPRGSMPPELWRAAVIAADLSTPSVHLTELLRASQPSWGHMDADLKAAFARLLEETKEKEEDETKSLPR